METILIVALLVGFVSLGAGAVLGYLARQTIAKQQAGTLEAKITTQLQEAKQAGKEIILQAKDKAVALLEKAKIEEDALKQKFINAQETLAKREESLDGRITRHESNEKELVEKVIKLCIGLSSNPYE